MRRRNVIKFQDSIEVKSDDLERSVSRVVLDVEAFNRVHLAGERSCEARVFDRAIPRECDFGGHTEDGKLLSASGEVVHQVARRFLCSLLMDIETGVAAANVHVRYAELDSNSTNIMVRKTIAEGVDLLSPSLAGVELNDGKLGKVEVIPDIFALPVHIFTELSGMELHLSLERSNLVFQLLEFSLSLLCTVMDDFTTFSILHDLKSTGFASDVSELADSLVVFVVFAEVLATASIVRALKSRVQALKSVLVDFTPGHFLHASLTLVLTGNLQFFELVNDVRMCLAGLKPFKVAAWTGKDVLILSLVDTFTAKVDPAVRTLAGFLKHIFADHTEEHLINFILFDI
jgi:hypothetical protein